MSVKEYALKFMQLSTYTPIIVKDPKERMIQFVLCALNLVDKEFLTTILVKGDEIYYLIFLPNKLTKENLRKI